MTIKFLIMPLCLLSGIANSGNDHFSEASNQPTETILCVKRGCYCIKYPNGIEQSVCFDHTRVDNISATKIHFPAKPMIWQSQQISCRYIIQDQTGKVYTNLSAQEYIFERTNGAFCFPEAKQILTNMITEFHEQENSQIITTPRQKSLTEQWQSFNNISVTLCRPTASGLQTCQQLCAKASTTSSSSLKFLIAGHHDPQTKLFTGNLNLIPVNLPASIQANTTHVAPPENIPPTKEDEKDIRHKHEQSDLEQEVFLDQLEREKSQQAESLRLHFEKLELEQKDLHTHFKAVPTKQEPKALANENNLYEPCKQELLNIQQNFQNQMPVAGYTPEQKIDLKAYREQAAKIEKSAIPSPSICEFMNNISKGQVSQKTTFFPNNCCFDETMPAVLHQYYWSACGIRTNGLWALWGEGQAVAAGNTWNGKYWLLHIDNDGKILSYKPNHDTSAYHLMQPSYCGIVYAPPLMPDGKLYPNTYWIYNGRSKHKSELIHSAWQVYAINPSEKNFATVGAMDQWGTKLPNTFGSYWNFMPHPRVLIMRPGDQAPFDLWGRKYHCSGTSDNCKISVLDQNDRRLYDLVNNGKTKTNFNPDPLPPLELTGGQYCKMQMHEYTDNHSNRWANIVFEKIHDRIGGPDVPVVEDRICSGWNCFDKSGNFQFEVDAAGVKKVAMAGLGFAVMGTILWHCPAAVPIAQTAARYILPEMLTSVWTKLANENPEFFAGLGMAQNASSVLFAAPKISTPILCAAAIGFTTAIATELGKDIYIAGKNTISIIWKFFTSSTPPLEPPKKEFNQKPPSKFGKFILLYKTTPPVYKHLKYGHYWRINPESESWEVREEDNGKVFMFVDLDGNITDKNKRFRGKYERIS